MLSAISYSDPKSTQGQPIGLQSLPPFPAAATRLLQLLSKEDFEQAELVDVVKVDPMFAAELLRTVNSARFYRMQPISGIQHAAAILGRETLKSFATAISMRLYLGKVLRQEPLARVWQHSLATAACCEVLAQAAGKLKDRPYVAGLLHDVGSLGMMVLHPKEYADVLAQTSEGSIDQRALEVEKFGFDHCVAGEWIARNWKLGSEIEETALRHHDPPLGRLFSTLEIVKAGVLLVDAMGWSAVPTISLTPAGAVAMLPTHFREVIKMDPDEIYASIAARIDMFGETGTRPERSAGQHLLKGQGRTS